MTSSDRVVIENAFGSTSLVAKIITKHYRRAIWKQFQKLIGSADIVEGSVGLVANLGELSQSVNDGILQGFPPSRLVIDICMYHESSTCPTVVIAMILQGLACTTCSTSRSMDC